MKEYGMIMRKALQEFLQNVNMQNDSREGLIEMSKIKMKMEQNYMTSSDGHNSVPYSRQDYEDQIVFRKEIMS